MKSKLEINENEALRMVLNVFQDDANVHLWRRNIGGSIYKNRTGKDSFVRFGEKGQSDIYGYANVICDRCGKISRGIHVEIELKASDGKLTEYQEQWIAKTKGNDAIAFVFQPKSDEELLNCRRIITDEINKHCPYCKNVTETKKPFIQGLTSIEEFKRLYR